MTRSLVDGEPVESIPVTDASVLRGDGCFEACRVYGGSPFLLDRHLDRLERSAAALDIVLPDRATLEAWCRAVATGGDEIIRIVVSRGDAVPGAGGGPRTIVMTHPLPAPIESVALMRVVAPWHPAGRKWELAGAKTVSYAPNLSASRVARAAGFDDAVLVSDDDLVLEGPTFTVGWVSGGVLETPELGLLILDSITRQVLLEEAAEMAIPVEQVRAPWSRLHDADEVLALSTVKEVTPVSRLGDRRLEPGPVTHRLQAAFRERVEDELGRSQGVAGQPAGS